MEGFQQFEQIERRQTLADQSLNRAFPVFSVVVKAVQGNYTEWSDWSDCSTSCGPGEKFRTRNCTNPPPAFGGMDCSFIGMDRDVQKCEKRPCAGECKGLSLSLLIVLGAIFIYDVSKMVIQ